jgi:hypothetical protein
VLLSDPEVLIFRILKILLHKMYIISWLVKKFSTFEDGNFSMKVVDLV